MIRRIIRAAVTVVSVFVMFAAATLVTGGFFSAAAAPPCKATWTIGIGGLNDNTSQRFAGVVDQRVGYNSYDTQSGANELNRLMTQHRQACPSDHIKAIGHSGGAAALHVWATQSGAKLSNVNIILIADPKRPAGPDGPGFAATDFPFNVIRPLAGADANYGGVPTLQVCNRDDHICNSRSSWAGYQTGAHDRYDFNPNNYSNTANGQIYR